MPLSIGIVGLPNVGKSTLFNALTRKSVLVANYPFATIAPSVGVVAVPDERLWKLSEFSKSAKTVSAAIEFVDIAGLVKRASDGEGLGNQFLSNIRETDAIAHVVRIFEDDNIIHVNGKINPLQDIEVINLELGLADLQTVTKRLANINKEVKAGKKEAVVEHGLLERLKSTLEAGKLGSTIITNEFEVPFLKSLHLLTTKPFLYVLNKKAGGKNLDEIDDKRWKELMDFLGKGKSVSKSPFEKGTSPTYVGAGDFVIVDAGIEHELKDLEPSEKKEFKDKFIRAEVIEWDKLLEAGSYAKAREKGWVRIEGKEYVVKDGDVVEFKI